MLSPVLLERLIHPDFSDLTPSPHINGKIRYTQGSKLHVHRGQSLRQGDKYEQYRGLASEVLHSSHYQGGAFSYGDQYMHDCATGHAGTGNQSGHMGTCGSKSPHL